MDQLLNERTILLSNNQVGPRLHIATLRSPSIAQNVLPGQFVHMRICGMDDHILRRPFSIFDSNPEEGTIDILYQVVGYGTNHLSMLSPETMPEEWSIELVGPVGTTWKAYKDIQIGQRPKALLVGGGVGAAPLFLLAKELKRAQCEFDVVIGAQTEDALVTLDRYKTLLGYEPFCATDDGSYGFSGFCTLLANERLEQGTSQSDSRYDYVAVCGPTPVMKIVAGYAMEHDVACEVSMEKRMACGIGACLSCVVDTVDGKKRSCVDGPVFDARKVIW